MKNLWLVLLLATATAAQTNTIRNFTGEIADSSCALNVHSLSRSHKEMIKAKYLGNTPDECARYCVRNLGSNFVLVSGKDIYHLDRQEDVAKFAGKRVVIKGKLDGQANTIAITSIE